MKKIKALSFLVLTAIVCMAFPQTTFSKTALNDAFLQSALDANGHAITNADGIILTNKLTLRGQTATNFSQVVALSGATNGMTTLVYTNPTTLVYTNALPGLTNLSSTVGLNATNYANLLGANSTNYANLIGANDTNYTKTATNNLASTNYVNTLATSGTNYANTVGLNTTNLALLIGANDTNFVKAATNGLVTATVTNGLATTNYANTVAANATNYANQVGLNTTNLVNASTNFTSGINVNNVRATNNITSLSGSFIGNGNGLTNLIMLIQSSTNVIGLTNLNGTGVGEPIPNTGLSFTLGPGTWDIQAHIVTHTESTTSGMGGMYMTVGTEKYLGHYVRGAPNVNSTSYGYSQVEAHTATSIMFAIAAADAPSKDAYSESSGIITIAPGTTNTYNPWFGQRTAVDAVNLPLMTTNSYIKIQRIF